MRPDAAGTGPRPTPTGLPGTTARRWASATRCAFLVLAWVARHVPVGAGPILDAGCGTGLSGPFAKALGYEVEGLDLSPEMLKLAGARGAYAKLTQKTSGKPLPWPDHHFAAFFSTGVFTEGHAPASGLDELVRIVRPAGHAIVTVRDEILEQLGFNAKFAELERADHWRLIERSPSYRAFVLAAEPEAMIHSFVFEVL